MYSLISNFFYRCLCFHEDLQHLLEVTQPIPPYMIPQHVPRNTPRVPSLQSLTGVLSRMSELCAPYTVHQICVCLGRRLLRRVSRAAPLLGAPIDSDNNRDVFRSGPTGSSSRVVRKGFQDSRKALSCRFLYRCTHRRSSPPRGSPTPSFLASVHELT